ncbi:MAG TPA: hypothetical protein VF056_13280 [Thermoleophilaceae bacterium]
MNGKSIALVVGGTLASLFAAGLLAIGGLALWGDSQKDSDGYLSTGTHQFETGTRALATENLDVDLGDADLVAQSNDLGKARVQVESRDDKPVFVGIARNSDVEDYLAGVSHSTLTDVNTSPFEAEYDDHAGSRHPVAPSDSNIWAASQQGTGQQTLNWEIEDGDWSVVVMNADGSAGVDADISTGAELPFLTALGWTAVGSGGFVLVIGVALLVLGIRRPSNPSGTARVTHVAPSAA